MGTLVGMALIVAVLAIRARPLTLLLASPVLAPFSEQWNLGGVLIDSTDLVLAGLAGMWIVRPRSFHSTAPIPSLGTWFIVGALASAAYVAAPQHWEYITNPIRLSYQLYRYCWKPLLFYPITAMLVREKADFDAVLRAAVLGAVLTSVEAISQGYSGLRATGPFGYGANAMGGVLVLPVMACVFGLMEPPSPRARWVFGVATLLIFRALVFSGSRGAMAGVLGGGMVVVAGLRATTRGRQRLRRLANLGLFVVVVVTLIRGNPLERPAMQRFIKGDQQEEEYGGTFMWRIEERWPHFLAQVRESPWLGWGTDIDLSLGPAGNTPHNGYLSIAVTSGVPSLAVFVYLVVGALRAVWTVSRLGRDAWERPLGVVVMAALVGVLVHNLVDSMFTVAPVGQLFWAFVAMAYRLDRLRVTPTKTGAIRDASRARGLVVAVGGRRG